MLVTSFGPTEAFIYKRGFARLSSEQYSTDAKSLGNRFVHLTNSSVNNSNSTHSDVTDDDKERGGSKVSLEFCFKRMQQRGIDTDAVWHSIVDVVCKSLYCVQDVIPWHPSAFELFGYDVLIDSDLKPWLIEVNSSPSLARDNALDHEIKDALLRDVLAVVDAPAVDRTALRDVLQVRRRWG